MYPVRQYCDYFERLFDKIDVISMHILTAGMRPLMSSRPVYLIS